jgi:hypothetical protein
MLTFAGEGYSPEFVTNFERIARLIGAGDQTVEIVFAPDDICAALLEDVRGHCRESSVSERDRVAAEALTGLLGQAVVENARIELREDILEHMRGAFAAGTIRQACHGCQWSPLCDRIASAGFSNTSLHCAGRR